MLTAIALAAVCGCACDAGSPAPAHPVARHRDSGPEHGAGRPAEWPGVVEAEIGVTSTAPDAAGALNATRAKVQALIDACTSAGIAPVDVRLTDLLSAPAGTAYRTQASVRITLRGSVSTPAEMLAATIAADGPSVYLERISATS